MLCEDYSEILEACNSIFERRILSKGGWINSYPNPITDSIQQGFKFFQTGMTICQNKVQYVTVCYHDNHCLAKWVVLHELVFLYSKWLYSQTCLFWTLWNPMKLFQLQRYSISEVHCIGTTTYPDYGGVLISECMSTKADLTVSVPYQIFTV